MQNSTAITQSASAAHLVEMVRAATKAVEANRDVINALNVFPVPDGDTGTNMLLSLRSVTNDIVDVQSSSISDVSRMMARSALLGARGNSGLILAQFFKGLATALENKTELDGKSFASALRVASDNSYSAVPNPVEGTMLTVYRECADYAEQIAAENNSFSVVLAKVVECSIETVRRTPELLPVLAEAEVVDSGGFGFAVMFDGALRALRGEEPYGRVVRVPLPDGKTFNGVVKTDFIDATAEIDWGYCTVFAIQAETLDIDEIRSKMAQVGRSPIVDGTDGIAKIHVHMEDPGQALSIGLKYGRISNIEIANMDEQAADWASDRRDDEKIKLVGASTEAPEIAIVAVAAGDGIIDLFKSTGLGATSIVEGGDTMNPSVADLLGAVEAAPSERVILLPNNKNVLAAAKQIPDLTAKDVRVIPSRSVQTGIAALLALNMDLPLDQNVDAMIEIIDEVKEGRVCKASRDVTIHGHNIRKGMTFAVFEDTICAVGRDPLFVLVKLIETHSGDAEIVTVYTGELVTTEQVIKTTETLANEFRDLDIEIVYGGQPHYDYLVAVE